MKTFFVVYNHDRTIVNTALEANSRIEAIQLIKAEDPRIKIVSIVEVHWISSIEISFNKITIKLK